MAQEEGNHTNGLKDRQGGAVDDTPVKPSLSFEQGVELVQRLYGLTDVVCLREFVSYDNQNLLIEARWPEDAPGSPAEKFVLKLTNSADSKEVMMHQQLNDIMIVLKESCIPCCCPIQNLEGKDLTLEELSFKNKNKDTGEMVTGHFLTRLMSYIPGQPIQRAPVLTAKMCYEAGQLLGRLSSAFENYKGDKTLFRKRNGEYIWSLANLPRIRSHLNVVTEDAKRKVVEEIMDAFDENVLKIEDKLKRGMIHGDFNDFNILVRADQTNKSHPANGTPVSNDNDASLADVIGILDFDDAMYSCVVYDVGIALMYIMQCSNLERPPLVSAGIMLAGFLSKHALSDDEWQALYYCVAARLVQSLVLGLHNYSQEPWNDYLLSTQTKGWEVTFELWAQDVNKLYGRWRDLIVEYNQ